MPQTLQNWWRMTWRLKVYSLSVVLAAEEREARCRGVKARTDPTRWQREQLQAAGLEMSTMASNATAPHWQEPYASAVIPAPPSPRPLKPKTRRAPA